MSKWLIIFEHLEWWPNDYRNEP